MFISIKKWPTRNTNMCVNVVYSVNNVLECRIKFDRFEIYSVPSCSSITRTSSFAFRYLSCVSIRLQKLESKRRCTFGHLFFNHYNCFNVVFRACRELDYATVTLLHKIYLSFPQAVCKYCHCMFKLTVAIFILLTPIFSIPYRMRGE